MQESYRALSSRCVIALPLIPDSHYGFHESVPPTQPPSFPDYPRDRVEDVGTVMFLLHGIYVILQASEIWYLRPFREPLAQGVIVNRPECECGARVSKLICAAKS